MSCPVCSCCTQVGTFGQGKVPRVCIHDGRSHRREHRQQLPPPLCVCRGRMIDPKSCRRVTSRAGHELRRARWLRGRSSVARTGTEAPRREAIESRRVHERTVALFLHPSSRSRFIYLPFFTATQARPSRNRPFFFLPNKSASGGLKMREKASERERGLRGKLRVEKRLPNIPHSFGDAATFFFLHAISEVSNFEFRFIVCWTIG